MQLRLVEVGQFVVRAQHFNNLVLVLLLHVVASGTEVLAGVKFTRLFGKYLTDGSGHGQAGVRVDVDLANGTLGESQLRWAACRHTC